MCVPGLIAGLTGAGAGAAAATGATAAAATAGSLLQTVGTVLSIGGAIAQGVQARNAYEDQAKAIEVQRQEEQQIALVEDLRTRRAMRQQIAQQRAELGARGVSLDSPTAVLLGETAARELSFASQSVRSGASARSRELSSSARLARSRGASAMMTGTISGASRLLTAAPTLWPGLSGGAAA